MDYASYKQVFRDLEKTGLHILPLPLEKTIAEKIYTKARALRTFGKNMFLSEKTFNKNPQYWGVNPTQDRNFIHAFQEELLAIEQSPLLTSYFDRLLGKGYLIHNKKFVCGVPDTWIPSWVTKKINNISIANLGAFIKPEYRDITYFHGIDFHQDIIDYPAWPAEKKTPSIITLYIYIHEVTEKDAPLFVMPGSHIYGASRFPHTLRHTSPESNQWEYHDDDKHTLVCTHHVLTGPAGYTAFWLPYVLHGTQPVAHTKTMRLSLRYILQRSPTARHAGIDTLLQHIQGPLYLEKTREDIDTKGQAIVTHNLINKID